MAIIDLDADYMASFFPYRHGSGYVAKGTVFRKGKPVEIFEAHGRTLSGTAEAALSEAKKIHRRLKASTYRKARERAAKKSQR